MVYELMVLVVPTVDMTDAKTQRDLIEKLIAGSATVKEITNLGKKQLSYPIRKLTEATYLLAILDGNVKSAVLDKKSKVMDDILRFMLVTK